MPVPYPAAMPTSGITTLNWTNSTASLISRSPFTFQGQAQAYPGAIRSAQVSVDNLNRDEVEDWVGFLDSLYGTIGTFLFGDPAAITPMGVGGGSPVVQNVGATDAISVATSYTSGVTRWLMRGDWVQIGTGLNSRLYKVSTQVNLNSSGVGTIIFWPSFRRRPVAGESVFINNPKGLFRRSNGSYTYTESNDCKYSLSFDCEEVI